MTRHTAVEAHIVSAVDRARTELGAFLRARRDRLSPAQAGISPFPGARRVPGLRKDELAVAAGLSPDYYSRLEQGRQTNVSDQVLDAIAGALRLDDVERAHLHSLAAPIPRRRGGDVVETPQRPDPGLLRIMTALDNLPVLLLGHRGDVLARNALLPAVLGRPLEPGTSFVRYLFLDPRARERIVNWDVFARAAVGALRLEAGKRLHDRRLRELIDELRGADPDVASWWEDHAVRDYASVTKHIRHPKAGDLIFGIEAVAALHEPDQRLTIYTVEPDSPTAGVLPLLSSWSLETADST
jgi:transcriptional regulator with XRE-family HTH domain